MNRVYGMKIGFLSLCFILGIGFTAEKSIKSKAQKSREQQLCKEKKREAIMPIKAEIINLKAQIKKLTQKEFRSTEQYHAIRDDLKELKMSKKELSDRLRLKQELKNQLMELKKTQKDSKEVAALKIRLKELRVDMKQLAGAVDCTVNGR